MLTVEQKINQLLLHRNGGYPRVLVDGAKIVDTGVFIVNIEELVVISHLLVHRFDIALKLLRRRISVRGEHRNRVEMRVRHRFGAWGVFLVVARSSPVACKQTGSHATQTQQKACDGSNFFHNTLFVKA